jgi:hypothetical protein
VAGKASYWSGDEHPTWPHVVLPALASYEALLSQVGPWTAFAGRRRTRKIREELKRSPSRPLTFSDENEDKVSTRVRVRF